MGWAFKRGLFVRTGLWAWLDTGQVLPTAWRVRLPLLGVAMVCIAACVATGAAAQLPTATLALVISALLASLLAERSRLGSRPAPRRGESAGFGEGGARLCSRPAGGPGKPQHRGSI